MGQTTQSTVSKHWRK